MAVNANSVPRGSTLDVDLCVVGAGAAGLALARELNGWKGKVALIESGSDEHHKATQDLYDGKNVGRHYFVGSTRVRKFGGSSNHWTGECRPLDPMDFEARDWVPHSGWPIGRETLDPFYRRAHEFLSLGEFQYDIKHWEQKLKAPRLPLSKERWTADMFRISKKQRLAKEYGPSILRSDNIDTYFMANAVDIEVGGENGEVEKIHIKTLEGNHWSVKARVFVLAMGGLETPRLLLASRKQRPNGVGNQHDVVGRYWADHPHINLGYLLPSLRAKNYKLYQRTAVGAGDKVFAVLRMTEEFLRKEGLNGIGMQVELANANSEASEKYLRGDLKYYGMKEEFRYEVNRLLGRTGALANQDVAQVGGLENLWSTVSRRKQGLPDNKTSAVPLPAIIRLRARVEPTPNPQSRVTLLDEPDALGTPKLQLDWRLDDRDQDSLWRTMRVLGIDVGRAGLGRLFSTMEGSAGPRWPFVMGGGHHMGATRMSENPRQGVVDPQCQVHGHPNLYIAGSSVFPTYGFANPTLTLVALSIRLADHLKETIR